MALRFTIRALVWLSAAVVGSAFFAFLAAEFFVWFVWWARVFGVVG